MRKLLVVASMPGEFTGILAHARDARPARFGVDWARFARLGDDEWLMLANGAGPLRAHGAVKTALPEFPADALVSTGFCGALLPEMGLGEIVVATEVAGENGRFQAASPGSPKRYHQGVVRTIDHIAQSAEEKGRLRNTGACAVEMEAAAVAEQAAIQGLPFYCVKAITDLAGENLANNLNGALRSDGHFDTIRILGSTMRRPLVRLPELFRLRKRSVWAAHALGEFFADCRF